MTIFQLRCFGFSCLSYKISIELIFLQSSNPNFQGPVQNGNADILKKGGQMLDEMDSFRRDYSNRGFKMFGVIKTDLMDSDDTHFSEAQSAYEWASLIKTVLKALLRVQSEGTKRAINKMLDDGIQKLDTDLHNLQHSSMDIDELKWKTTKLMSDLDAQYEKEIQEKRVKWQQMYDTAKSLTAKQRNVMNQLKEKMDSMKRLHDELAQRLSENIVHMESKQSKLKDEIDNIDSLRSKIDPLKALLNSDSTAENLNKSGQELLAECDKFRERYSQNTNLV